MKRIIILFCLVFVSGGALVAQTISASQGSGTYINFQSQAQLDAGGTSMGNIQIQFSTPGGRSMPNWKLTVQVTSPILTNGTSLEPQFISLQHNPSISSDPSIANAIQAPNSYIPLGFQEVVLIESSAHPLMAPPDYSFNIRYNLKIQGGQPVIDLQNGDYPVRLTFRLYDRNGNLRSSSSTTYGFGKYYRDPHAGGPNAYRTITLINGAHDVSLNFSSDEDYQRGVSVNIPNGLKVQGQASYQINVRSNTSTFTSSQSSVIPVSAVKLQSSPGNLAPEAVFSNLTLSNNSQTLIRKTSWSDPNPVYYNLRYYTLPNDVNIRSAGGGSYTTILYFLLEPN